MLTLQIVQRNYNGNLIRQRSDNKFLCATDLLAIYNNQTHGKSRKIMADFLDSQDFKEHLIELSKYLKVENSILSQSPSMTSIEKVENSTFSHLMMVKKGKNGGTWLNELSFLKFAMWLSKEFEIWALIILRDHLIEYRLDAGDNFKEMMQVLKEKLNPVDKMQYQYEAMMINEVCFGLPALNRNTLSEPDLRKLNKAQEVNIKLLKNGILNRQDRKKKLRDFFELY